MYSKEDWEKLIESIDWNILEAAEMAAQMGGQPGFHEMTQAHGKLREAKTLIGKVITENDEHEEN